MLDALDLDPTEQAVYETLIDSPPLTLQDLQAPRAVESLEARGLICRIPGNPVRYAAISPDVALEVLFLERERQIKRARGYAEQLSARFHQAASGRDPAELVEILTGRPAIRQRWAQMQRSAKHEIRGIDKPPYTVASTGNVEVETELLRSGISYRIIYDSAGLESFHDWESDIERSIRYGEQARVLSSTPTKLVIIDERMAMIPLQAAPESIVSMVVVHPSGLLEALCAFFEDLWRRALPLTSPTAAGTTDSPTDDERRLLSLLATGMPDAAIAKHLGVSHRTFQRRLRELFDRLGVETRFQAGVRSAQRGW